MQAPEYRRRLGQRIRKLRTQKRWSQEGFAEICEVNRSYMGRIERGELNLTLETLEKIGRGLNTQVSTLLRGIL